MILPHDHKPDEVDYYAQNYHMWVERRCHSNQLI